MSDSATTPAVDSGESDVDAVFDAVVETAPEIRAQLAEQRADAVRENPSGERVSAADDFADRRLRERLLSVDCVASYASEEREEVITGSEGGGYHLAVDPLDGSSNVTSNNPMGTIVGVYDEPLPASGRDLVAAGFVLYGPNTTMLATDGDTVTETLLSGGTRQTLDEDCTLPEDPTVYGVGGRRPDWTSGVRAAVESMEADRLKLRYGGAFVADICQVLTHGGLFAYPELQGRPEGKLRYHFECAPVGFLIEAAGGRASNGYEDLLGVEPTELHERTPFYAGNERLVTDLERELAADD